MSAFPNSPRLVKGGIVLVDPDSGAVKKIIVLQYNPDTLTRTLQPQGVKEEGGDRSEALRLTGPPIETIKLDAEIDATDQLEFPDQNRTAVEFGIQPQLAALETIVYPASSQLLSNNSMAQAGMLEILPMISALPLFIWSKSRIVPVRITDFSITEEAFDPSLRQAMEQRFGHDFSRVRVHSGGAAEQSARDVSAKAYTVGHNIVFGAGKYTPGTHDGRRLIAHELIHVVQQNQERSIFSVSQLQREPDDQLSPKDRQLACVVRLGGCTSGTYSRDAGTAKEHIPGINKTCKEKEKTTYDGPDLDPSPDECNNPPKEPLPTGAKILLGTFIVVGSGLAIAATVVAAEAVIPIVIASIVEAGTASYGFYLANAFVVNEIGLFSAGLLMACEGDVVALLRAIANIPEQAVKILAEVYVLHTTISVNNAPPRPATLPVKLLPQSQQEANSGKIRFKTVGSPHFEDTSTPEKIPSSPVPKTTAPTSKPAPPSAPVAPDLKKQPLKPPTVLAPGMSTGEADEAAALKRARPDATLLGEKAGGYDATQGGEKITNSEEIKKDKAGNQIIVRDVTIRQPDDAIQIKTITQIDKYGRPSLTPLPQLVADNVTAALKKAYNQPVTRVRARTPLPGTNIYERTNVEAPKKITIILQVPDKVTDEMRDAAARVLATDTSVAELPPIEVIVQTRQVEAK